VRRAHRPAGSDVLTIHARGCWAWAWAWCVCCCHPHQRPPRKGPAPVIAPGATVVIKPEDLVQLCAKDAEFDDTNDTSGQAVQGIGTDTAISKTKLGTLVNRKLEKADAWVSPNAAVGGLEEMSRGRGKSGQWDQFEANRRLFNVESSFDEDQYTTPLNRREFSRYEGCRLFVCSWVWLCAMFGLVWFLLLFRAGGRALPCQSVAWDYSPRTAMFICQG